MAKVRTLRQGGFLYLTLDDAPTRNALSSEMVQELQAAVEAAAADPTLRAVVLRGANGFFCAGGSMGNFQERLKSPEAQGGADPIAAHNRRFGDFMIGLARLPKVLVAVIEGAAMGGGIGLACAADIVIARRDAKFALSETTLGLVPAQIAPFVVARIGQARARRLALSGERIDAIEAVRIGLVDFVADDANAMEARLLAVLRGIARCAPGANAATKALLQECAEVDLGLILDRAAQAFARQMRSEGAEGVAAFRDKRDASWVEKVERLPRTGHDEQDRPIGGASVSGATVRSPARNGASRANRLPVFDYLAELTMSIWRRRASPDAGYATDFVDVAMESVIGDIGRKGIKVVSNAGGVNPAACAAALARLAEKAGMTLNIAIVEGDDVLPRMAELRAGGVREMYSGAELPQRIFSANAYLGAIPIARAPPPAPTWSSPDAASTAPWH
jgi:isohexenylglutaconyl-CoA hydratase